MKPNRYPYSGKKVSAITKLDSKLIKRLAVDTAHISSLMSGNSLVGIELDAGTLIFQ